MTASANVKDPQTFNRYSYAMNSPYKFTDPLGLVAEDNGGFRLEPTCPIKGGCPVQVSPTMVEPKINVTVDVEPAEIVVNRKLPNGKFFTGVSSTISITFTDSDNHPIIGATVSESNTPEDGSSPVEREGVIETDENGVIYDILGTGRVNEEETQFLDKGVEINDDELKGLLVPLTNATALDRTSTQTLTENTPDKETYSVTWTRTIGNVDQDGNFNKALNKNGLNVKVKYSKPIVRRITSSTQPNHE